MTSQLCQFVDEDVATVTSLIQVADRSSLLKFSLALPQVELPVIHRFGPGIYIRECRIPAGTYIIGHIHKHAHFNVMLEGRLRLFSSDGSVSELSAPTCFTAPPGSKTAIILEEVVWQNVYATEETDIGKLEAMLFEDCEEAEVDRQERFVAAVPLLAADREDFLLACAEFGLSPGLVRVFSEHDSDLLTLRPLAQKVRLAPSPIEGTGLFATAPIEPGEVIYPMRLAGCRTIAGRFTNHAKAPNAEAVLLPNGDMNLVALRHIQGCMGGRVGEEITIDYRLAMAFQFKRGDKLCLLESQ